MLLCSSKRSALLHDERTVAGCARVVVCCQPVGEVQSGLPVFGLGVDCRLEVIFRRHGTSPCADHSEGCPHDNARAENLVSTRTGTGTGVASATRARKVAPIRNPGE